MLLYVSESNFWDIYKLLFKIKFSKTLTGKLWFSEIIFVHMVLHLKHSAKHPRLFFQI